MAFRTMIIDEGTPDKVIWKCRTEDFEYGAHLVVHPYQVAVFINQGIVEAVLGNGEHVLETKNYLFLRKFTKLMFGRTFHCEVYFLNGAKLLNQPWGVGGIETSVYTANGQLDVTLGVSGIANVQIDVTRSVELATSLLNSGGTFTEQDLRRLYAPIYEYIVTNYLADRFHNPAFDIFNPTANGFLETVSRELEARLAPEFAEHGFVLKKFIVNRVATPKDSRAYQEARLQREKETLQPAQLEHELKMKRLSTLGNADIAGNEKVITAQYDSQAAILKAQAEKARRDMEGITSIQEHQFETTNNMIRANASAGVNPSSGAAGMMRDMMQFGATMQMMQGASDMMKNVMAPAASIGTQAASSVMNGGSGTWTCKCGHVNGAESRFCGGCGEKKPEPAGTWTCSCGQVNPASNRFCGGCGAKKPEDVPAGFWKCKCGKLNPAASAFCGGCGEKK